MTSKIEDIVFEPGDMIIDSIDNETGILMEKYAILPGHVYESGYTTEPIWAWRILWSGADKSVINRWAAYTENGLRNIVFYGRANLIKAKRHN